MTTFTNSTSFNTTSLHTALALAPQKWDLSGVVVLFETAMKFLKETIWLLIKIGFLAALIPTVLYVLTQLVPAVLTMSSGAMVK